MPFSSDMFTSGQWNPPTSYRIDVFGRLGANAVLGFRCLRHIVYAFCNIVAIPLWWMAAAIVRWNYYRKNPDTRRG